MSEDPGWQRLDKWLWCARFQKQRADCARLVEGGGARINRQPTDKPHARLRVGDMLTIATARDVIVVIVRALADRRGPPAEARALYEIVPEGARAAHGGCESGHSAAYRATVPPDTRSA